MHRGRAFRRQAYMRLWRIPYNQVPLRRMSVSRWTEASRVFFQVRSPVGGAGGSRWVTGDVVHGDRPAPQIAWHPMGRRGSARVAARCVSGCRRLSRPRHPSRLPGLRARDARGEGDVSDMRRCAARRTGPVLSWKTCGWTPPSPSERAEESECDFPGCVQVLPHRSLSREERASARNASVLRDHSREPSPGTQRM